jgi:hypothetical protein
VFNKLKNLKLRRWQIWILIAVALWMIYSGITQLQREGKLSFIEEGINGFVVSMEDRENG